MAAYYSLSSTARFILAIRSSESVPYPVHARVLPLEFHIRTNTIYGVIHAAWAQLHRLVRQACRLRRRFPVLRERAAPATWTITYSPEVNLQSVFPCP